MKNDITFLSASSFFYGNTEDDSGFLTYVMPYRLEEGLDKVSGKKKEIYFERMRKVLEPLGDEANPILVEYKIR